MRLRDARRPMRALLDAFAQLPGACEAFVLAPFRRCNREAVAHTGTGRRCGACAADDRRVITVAR